MTAEHLQEIVNKFLVDGCTVTMTSSKAIKSGGSLTVTIPQGSSVVRAEWDNVMREVLSLSTDKDSFWAADVDEQSRLVFRVYP